jgi:hypothetical protein
VGMLIRGATGLLAADTARRGTPSFPLLKKWRPMARGALASERLYEGVEARPRVSSERRNR